MMPWFGVPIMLEALVGELLRYRKPESSAKRFRLLLLFLEDENAHKGKQNNTQGGDKHCKTMHFK